MKSPRAPPGKLFLNPGQLLPAVSPPSILQGTFRKQLRRFSANYLNVERPQLFWSPLAKEMLPFLFWSFQPLPAPSAIGNILSRSPEPRKIRICATESH